MSQYSDTNIVIGVLLFYVFFEFEDILSSGVSFGNYNDIGHFPFIVVDLYLAYKFFQGTMLLWNKDFLGTSSYTRVQSEETGITPHYLDKEHTVV